MCYRLIGVGVGGGVPQFSMLWQTISLIRLSIQGLLCRKIYQCESSYLNKSNIYRHGMFPEYPNSMSAFLLNMKRYRAKYWSFHFLIRNFCFLNIGLWMISLKFLFIQDFKNIPITEIVSWKEFDCTLHSTWVYDYHVN